MQETAEQLLKEIRVLASQICDCSLYNSCPICDAKASLPNIIDYIKFRAEELFIEIHPTEAEGSND